MDKLINKIKFSNQEIIYYNDEFFDRELSKAIETCDTIYAFKSLNHFTEKSDLIEWMISQKTLILDRIELSTENGQKILSQMIDNDGVIVVAISNDNRKTLIEKFKFSINNIKNNYNYLQKNDSYYVDDPLYDQYDYLFCKNNIGILFTDIHNGFIVVNNEKNV